MDKKITVHGVTAIVPASVIRKRFGVKDRSIRLAKERGFFPANWYRGMKEICAKYGVDFSDDLFNWKTPKGTLATKHGNETGSLQEPDTKQTVSEVSP